jgi:small-conductance mechanosensitive channel
MSELLSQLVQAADPSVLFSRFALVQDDPAYLDEPAPTMVVTQLGDFNNTVQFRAWLDDEKQHLMARFRLREAAYRTLLQAGVDMPVQTFAHHPVEVRLPGPLRAL